MSATEIWAIIQAGAAAAALILAYGYKLERDERVKVTAQLIEALQSNIKMNEAWQRVLPSPSKEK